MQGRSRSRFIITNNSEEDNYIPKDLGGFIPGSAILRRSRRTRLPRSPIRAPPLNINPSKDLGALSPRSIYTRSFNPSNITESLLNNR